LKPFTVRWYTECVVLIAGAVFVEVFSVQNFTGYIYTGGDPFDTEQVYDVPKVFDAVARAVKAL
jgi:hypothetical protein